jgi:lysophospholipase L1-like esterase
MKQRFSTRRPRASSSSFVLDSLESRALLSAVKIMPLGDSITESSGGHASYRYWLWQQLGQAGYEVDFVGSNTGVAGGDPQFASFDQNHEGHSGYRADQIQSNITSWARAASPDVVLLHVGTNDIFQGQSNSSTITEIGGIIDNLRSVNPNVKIFLAQIIPQADNLSAVQNLNSLIPGLISQKNTSASPVILVDQYSGFSASTDTYDRTHPDESGEQKMAQKWYSALTNVLPAPPALPAGTFLSSLNPSSASNGWGSYERDKSNGEQGTGDGSVINLNNVTYRKGLGVHAASDLTYTFASGAYSEFRSDIGIDEETGGGGSVVFQVYVNGSLKYTSPKMTASSSTISVSVPLPAGSTSLRLVVNDAGDGNGSDHADWANARLISGAVTPPPTDTAPTAPSSLTSNITGNSVKLSWLDLANNESGYRVERRTPNGTYVQIASLAAGTTSFSDNNVSNGTTYFYRVYAWNTAGNSAYSNETSILFKKKR